MRYRSGFWDSVGRTPLIKLERLSAQTGSTILGKAEFLNPGGSVKDRAARGLVEDAEQRGVLAKGGTIVDGTAGNTGIGLAHVSLARGYRCVIVMPDNQSPEKYALIRTLGAELEVVKAVPYSDPNHYQRVAARRASEIAGGFWANQFDNPANREAHIRTTGPEIWRDTNGQLDAFVTSSGTGGTLGGVALFLKSQRPGVRTVLADPQGSSLYRKYTTGELQATGPGSITEGIGIGRVTANLAGAPIDEALSITDPEAVHFTYRLLREEGLFLGSSSGVNVAGAVRIARRLGPGHTVVTVLCDGGSKYGTRIYDRSWLEERGLARFADGATDFPCYEETAGAAPAARRATA
ncbi:MAG TPA: cysteine synthase A [Steroidobacteraceae bacterium]|nr:cysteine synthase A [Steroidobacteraceae bacterium]